MKTTRIVASLLPLAVLAGCAAQPAVAEPALVPATVTSTVPTPQPVSFDRVSAERMFLDAAERNYLNPVSDDELLYVAWTTCNFWDSGGSYKQVTDTMDRNLLSWSQREKDTLIILAALHLCPQHDGTYGDPPAG